MEEQLFTLEVFSENQVGLLNQITIIFTRRCLNIESLSVSPSSIEGIHKYIITCRSNRPMMERVIKQIEKRIDVLKAYLYTDEEIIYQEIALYKVPTGTLAGNSNAEAVIRNHNARILEVTPDYIVLERTGHREDTEQLFNELRTYGIMQFVRSGRVAVTRRNDERLSRYLEEVEQNKH